MGLQSLDVQRGDRMAWKCSKCHGSICMLVRDDGKIPNMIPCVATKDCKGIMSIWASTTWRDGWPKHIPLNMAAEWFDPGPVGRFTLRWFGRPQMRFYMKRGWLLFRALDEAVKRDL